jgi:hypothetical protein
MSVTRELRRQLRVEQSSPRFEPCLPRPAKQPPAGPGWIHEIKHDGFRILARRDGRSVRLTTRNGQDLAGRFPLAAAGHSSAARPLQHRRRRGDRLRVAASERRCFWVSARTYLPPQTRLPTRTCQNCVQILHLKFNVARGVRRKLLKALRDLRRATPWARVLCEKRPRDKKGTGKTRGFHETAVADRSTGSSIACHR